MSEPVEVGEVMAAEPWRRQVERRLIVGGVAVLLATAFVIAAQLLR